MVSLEVQDLQRLTEVADAHWQLRELVACSNENAQSLSLADAFWKALDVVVADVQVLESRQGKDCLRDALQLIRVNIEMLNEGLLTKLFWDRWDFVVGHIDLGQVIAIPPVLARNRHLCEVW